MWGDLGRMETDIFLQTGLDRTITDLPPGKSACAVNPNVPAQGAARDGLRQKNR
jgi:hypothetical protein